MTRITLTLLVPLVIAGDVRAQPDTRRNALIVGRVLDAGTGRPVSGAVVMVTSLDASGVATREPPPIGSRILTGGDGYFVFRNLPRGSFTILATKSGYTDGASGRRRPGGPSQPLTLSDGERDGSVIIKLWRHASISGMLTDEAGEPVVSVMVRALRKSLSNGRKRFLPAGTATTDDRGMYRLPRLVPGEYIVATSPRQVAVPLELARESGPGVSGATGSTISSIGGTTSLPGTSIATQSGNAVFPIGAGATIPAPGPDGRLFVYPPTFHPSADAVAQATSVTVEAGEERSGVDLQLHPVPTVRVAGVVAGLEPAGITIPVLLRPAGAADVGLDENWPATVTDSAGRFVFPAVPSGDYTLRAATRAQPASWAEVPLTVGRNDIGALTLSLQQGLRISGRTAFVGQSSGPTSGREGLISFVVEPADTGWELAIGDASAITIGGRSQFSTQGLPAGKYFVRVTGSPVGWMFLSAMHNGRDLSETPVELSGGDATGVVLTFTDRWSGLGGTVQSSRGASGERVEATVLVFPTDAEGWTDYGSNPRRVRSVVTGRDGEFKIQSLPPGDYYAVAVPDSVAADWQDPTFMEALARVATRITIGDGEHQTQNLRVVEMR